MGSHIREVLTSVHKSSPQKESPLPPNSQSNNTYNHAPSPMISAGPRAELTFHPPPGSRQCPVCFSKGIPLWESQGPTSCSVGWKLEGSDIFAEGRSSGTEERKPCPQLIAISLDERRQREALTPTVIHCCALHPLLPSFSQGVGEVREKRDWLALFLPLVCNL